MKPVIRFLLLALGFYILWYFIYNYWIHPNGTADLFVIRNSIVISRFVLETIGFDVYIEPRIIGITGGSGVWIGDSCNAISLFALYTIFMLVYPGAQSHKWWYVPLGIFSIHLMNCLRIIALVINEYYSPGTIEFNHTYTFTFIVYLFIFFLWLTWVRKFSTPTVSKSTIG